MRTKDDKLLHVPGFGDGNYWELFDLSVDGNELVTVYREPGYAETARRLHGALDSLRAQMECRAPT